MQRHELDPKRGRDGRPWARTVRSILVPGVECVYPPCACPWGREIDTTLPRTNRWSGTVDHTIPLSEGGHPTDPANLQPMHRACNSSKNGHAQAKQRAERRANTNTTRASRPW